MVCYEAVLLFLFSWSFVHKRNIVSLLAATKLYIEGTILDNLLPPQGSHEIQPERHPPQILAETVIRGLEPSIQYTTMYPETTMNVFNTGASHAYGELYKPDHDQDIISS